MIDWLKEILKRILRVPSSIEQLKQRGLIVGDNFFMNTGCQIDWSHCWLIEIGNNVTLASNVYVLAHDASTKSYLGYTRIAQVKIGNNVFIGANCIVMPGVVIGDNVIIGAGSIVTKNIPDDMVAVGSPAKVFCSTDDYIRNQKLKMNAENCFGEEYTVRGNINNEMKVKMKSYLEKHGEGFVV